MPGSGDLLDNDIDVGDMPRKNAVKKDSENSNLVSLYGHDPFMFKNISFDQKEEM